ncbi:MAG: hypothetical protein WCT08_04635 [Patescibacteria group bacterium]|jgi:hypothetical protein
MVNLDGIAPNPKKAKKKPKPSPLGVSGPTGEEARKRKKMVWFSVVSIVIIIVIVWFGTLESRLKIGNSNNSAWRNLKDKVFGVFSFSKPANEEIKKIDPNSPSNDQIQYLREQVFPSELIQADANSNLNQNSNLNINSNSNQNANAS